MSKAIYTQEDMDKVLNAVRKHAKFVKEFNQQRPHDYHWTRGDSDIAAHNIEAVMEKAYREIRDAKLKIPIVHPKRLAPGFYVLREPGGMFLHVFRYNNRWYYLRQPKQHPPEKVATLYANVPFAQHSNPTYRMALSAAQGNFKS